MDDSCAVCAEKLEWTAYGQCGHREVCSNCVARLRFICDDQNCCICKSKLNTIFVTKAQWDYTSVISDFSVFPSEPKEGKVCSYWYHEGTNAFFDDPDHYKTVKAMCRLSCIVCDKIHQQGNGNIKRNGNFKNIDQLKDHLSYHLSYRHKLVMCNLCLESRKGPVRLAKEETMLNNRARRDAPKLPEKGKPLTGNDRSGNGGNGSRRSVMGEKAAHLLQGNGSRRSVMGEKAAHLLQGNVKCKNLVVHKNPTTVQSGTKVSQPAVSRHIPTTCSNTKIDLDKANLNFGLKSKSSRHANVTNKVNNMSGERPSAVIAEKTLESSSRCMTRRSGQSENQKPKIISINRQTETNPNIRVGTQIKKNEGAKVQESNICLLEITCFLSRLVCL